MAIYRLGDLIPEIHENAYVTDSASVIGQAILGAEASIWFGAVIRADNEPIRIGRGTNIQDNAVLHVDPGYPLTIGDRVTVGHQAMLHGCTIGDGSLVGIQAVIMNGAEIGEECLVGAGAIVTEGKSFPPRSLILGAPAKIVRELSDEQVAGFANAASGYIERRQTYRELERLG